MAFAEPLGLGQSFLQVGFGFFKNHLLGDAVDFLLNLQAVIETSVDEEQVVSVAGIAVSAHFLGQKTLPIQKAKELGTVAFQFSQ